MPKPCPPAPGDVIRYAYLWWDEHRRGAEEGRKERPALVLAIVAARPPGDDEVLIVPITHSAPRAQADAVALTTDAARALGLDGQEHWIVVSEANAFVWPGPDIRPVPSRRPTTFTYGAVPRGLLRRVVTAYLERAGRVRVARRTE